MSEEINVILCNKILSICMRLMTYLKGIIKVVMPLCKNTLLQIKILLLRSYWSKSIDVLSENKLEVSKVKLFIMQ